MTAEGWKNKLYFGDNLDILRDEVQFPDECVDLIYLDPPFNSNATYNILFEEKSGEKSAAQITAFDDTWHWGLEAQKSYQEVITRGPDKLAALLDAMRAFLGFNDMMAYLTMMAVRLMELHRVLKRTGSIYLHCDPTASHYLKLIMDAIFGFFNFQNEIIWKRTSAHSSAKRYGPVHDVMLFYSKSSKFIWNSTYVEHNIDYINKYYNNVDPDGRRWMADNLTGAGVRHGETGKVWREVDITARGRHWMYPPSILDRLDTEGKIYWPKKEGGIPRLKNYLDELKGLHLQDIFYDIFPISAHAKERLGYPTQKPESLLERIILASSREDDVVLDPFCGCGTAIAVAERLHRRWIGIDITHLAITLIKNRLQTTFEEELADYAVIGVPKDLASARTLARVNRYQFEWWALGLVDARPAQEKKKGADTGIDGIINFIDDPSGKAKRIIVQVKSGKITVNQIRDLKGVLERENAAIGAFITLSEPTDPMTKEAATAGFYQPEHLPGLQFPRLQILTIEKLLAGRRLDYPRIAPEITFKKAPRRSKGPAPKDKQNSLL